MTGSIQGSAIDDSFETLTNAPDAWVSGRYAAPPPVDYQHYVEPGDTRSAVDDRCFTQYGAVEHVRPVSNMIKSSKPDQKRYRSRQKPTKPASHGKRRPSPSFRIRSKDGDSVTVSNPFVLRKPSRPKSREDSEASSQTDSQSQRSSTTAARSRTFQIRIKGKNGEEVIQDLERPLHFAPQSSGMRDSQATTAVGHISDQGVVKYWSANQSSSSHERKQTRKSKCEQHFMYSPSKALTGHKQQDLQLTPTSSSSRARRPPRRPVDLSKCLELCQVLLPHPPEILRDRICCLQKNPSALCMILSCQSAGIPARTHHPPFRNAPSSHLKSRPVSHYRVRQS